MTLTFGIIVSVDKSEQQKDPIESGRQRDLKHSEILMYASYESEPKKYWT